MKYMVLVLMAGALFGCATPREKCEEDNYWQDQGYNSIQQCARAVAEDRRNRWSAVSENLSNRKSFGNYYTPASDNTASRSPSNSGDAQCYGLRPMAQMGCRTVCINGDWSQVCR